MKQMWSSSLLTLTMLTCLPVSAMEQRNELFSFVKELGSGLLTVGISAGFAAYFLKPELQRSPNKYANSFSPDKTPSADIPDWYGDIPDEIQAINSYAEHPHFWAEALSDICLHGPTGSGKTALVRYVVQKLLADKNVKFFFITFGQISDGLLGGDARNIKALYDTARAKVVPPTNLGVILFDDAEKLFGKRSDRYRDNGSAAELLANLGSASAKIKGQPTIITILTTNLVGDIDEALIRPGRMKCVLLAGVSPEHKLTMIFSKLQETAHQLAGIDVAIDVGLLMGMVREAPGILDGHSSATINNIPEQFYLKCFNRWANYKKLEQSDSTLPEFTCEYEKCFRATLEDASKTLKVLK